MNRRCISNEEKPTLPDTLEQNKLPLVKNMIKNSSKLYDDIKELKQCYPDIPDEVVDLFNAVRANNSSPGTELDQVQRNRRQLCISTHRQFCSAFSCRTGVHGDC